jgi:hypothetical protein
MKKLIVGIVLAGFLAAIVFPTATMRFADRRWTPAQVMGIFSHILTPAHRLLLQEKLEALEKQEKMFNGGTLSGSSVLDIISIINMQAAQDQQSDSIEI